MPLRRSAWKKDVLPPHNLPLEEFPTRRKALPPWLRAIANADLSTGGRICYCLCHHDPFCEKCMINQHQPLPGQRPAYVRPATLRRFQ